MALALVSAQSVTAEAQSRQLTEEERRLLRQLVHPPVEPRLTFTAAVENAGGADLRANGEQSRAFGEMRLELDVAYESRLCRHVFAGAAVSLQMDQDEQAPGVEQWLGVCLIAGFPLPSVELDHRLEWRRRPRLDAPRLQRPGRYLKEEPGLTITMVDVGLKETARLQFGRTRVGVRYVSHDDPDAQDIFHMSVKTAMARYFRPRFGPLGRNDLVVDIMAAELEDAQGEVKDTIAAALIFARLRGLRLWTPHLLLDASGGLGYGGISPTYDPERPNAPILDEERRRITTPVFDVALYGGGQSIAGGVVGRRQIWAALSDEILIETRTTAWVRYRQPRFFALLDGFFALSEVRPFARPDEDHITGGGRLQLGWSPTEHAGGRHTFGLWLKLSGELARSFYSDTQSAAAPAAPSLGAQVMGSISASYDLGPR